MSDIDIEDKTGEPSTLQDIEEAILASKKMLVRIIDIPPDIGVYVTVIHRCLREYQAIRLELAKRGESSDG